MKRYLTTMVVAVLCACCLGFVACGGSGSSGAASTSVNAASSSASATSASASLPSASASTSSTSAGDKYDGYFVGKWDLYESDEYTHDQVVQVMEQYANDEETRITSWFAYCYGAALANRAFNGGVRLCDLQPVR